jgi:hypothetical protein
VAEQVALARIGLDRSHFGSGQDNAGPGGPRARPAVRSNLPAEISSFVGRAEDLARCADLLREGRLLTLTGAGGSGKTRLALRLAATLTARFPDGSGGSIWRR